MCVKISVSCNIKPASLAGSVSFNAYNTYRKKGISESGKLEIYWNCKIKEMIGSTCKFLQNLTLNLFEEIEIFLCVTVTETVQNQLNDSLLNLVAVKASIYV